MKQSPLVHWCLCAVLAGFATVAIAQSRPMPVPPLPLPAAATELDVTSAVVDSSGALQVTLNYAGPGALQAHDFMLMVGDLAPAYAVTVNRQTEVGHDDAVLVCLDTSGSVGRRALKEETVALESAIRAATAPGSADVAFDVGLCEFGGRIRVWVDYTRDSNNLVPGLQQWVPVLSQSPVSLYDGVAGRVASLRSVAGQRKRLVVISDGRDEGGSGISQPALRTVLQAEPRVPVDTILYVQTGGQRTGVLSMIADASGGRFTIARNMTTLTAAFQKALPPYSPPRYTVTFPAPAAHGSAATLSLMLVAPDGTAIRRPLTVK